MKQIMMAILAVSCLGAFTARSFADEMGKMPNGMMKETRQQADARRPAMKGQADAMKPSMDAMKGTRPAGQEDKTQHMKGQGDAMKSEMKGSMGK
jgi:hypothetical protein